MTIYRVLSSAGKVVYVFAAADAQEAEAFARQFSGLSRPAHPRAVPGRVCLEALHDDETWRQVCAWTIGI